MSHLRYLCFCGYSDVQRIFCCVGFVLFVFVFCMVVNNMYCVFYFVLFVFVVCMVVTNMYCVFCFVCLRLLHGGDQHVLCFWFVFFAFVLCLVNQILPVSLDCIFLITPSVSLTFNYIKSPVFSSKACRVNPFTFSPL